MVVFLVPLDDGTAEGDADLFTVGVLVLIEYWGLRENADVASGVDDEDDDLKLWGTFSQDGAKGST